MAVKTRALSFCFLVVLLEGILLNSTPILGAPSATFRIEEAVWGTSADNQITVEPGDTNVPLTLNVRNRSNYRLNGIYATLFLNSSVNGIYLFTNTSGGFEVNAVGAALQIGDIMYQTGEVLPGTAFSLTFGLNINEDTKPGSYYYPIRIEYLVNQSGIILEGTPQTLNAAISLLNRAPIIGSFTPMITDPTVYVGDHLNFSAICRDPDGDDLTYRWILDDVVVANSSWFIYQPNDGDMGSHTVELRLSDGNLVASQTWSVSVDKIRTTTVSVSSNYLTGGLDNPLVIALRNNLWKGTVEIRMNLPTQAPLVISGNSSWTFRGVEPNGSISIYPRIYAPASSIGATFTVGLTVSYSDEFGRSYTDTHNLGMVVKGLINLLVYDITVTPQTAYQGSSVTIVITLWNRGNTPAKNANASIQASPILTFPQMSNYYIGDIDKDSQEPFSIRAYVKPDVGNGTYPVTLVISYMDDQFVEHSMNITTDIAVAEKTGGDTSQSGENSLLIFLENGGWTIITLIGVAVILGVLYLRRTLKGGSYLAKK